MPAGTPPRQCWRVRQLAGHIPEIPLSIRSMGIWEKINDLLDDDCSFESYGQVLVAENEEELASAARRRRIERARFTMRN